MKNNLLLFVLLLLCNFLFANNNSSVTKEETEQWIKSQPVRFLENKGQMTDMNGNPVPFVLFNAEAPGMNIYITEKGLTYVFLKSEEEDREREEKETSFERISTEWERIDMFLKGAIIKKENIVKEKASSEFSQYYFTHCPDGITDVRTFEKIIVKEIYPGIDWVIYNSEKNGFKYDFAVHPGADPKQIEIVYSSLDKLKLDDEGNIIVKTEIGTLTENSPVSFLDGKEIETHFIKTLNEKNNNGGYDTHIQFNLPSAILPLTSDLVIDPQLVWATYFGGSGLDGAMDIGCDVSGNVYVTGYETSANMPVLNPGGGAYYQGTFVGQYDAYILKFTNAGVLLWATYYGGTGTDAGYTLCADPSGNLYVAGNTFSSNLPVVNPGGGAYFLSTLTGGYHAYITKFNTAGTLVWGTYFGANTEEQRIMAIASDANGNIFATGFSKGNNNLLPVANPGGGAYFQGTSASTVDAFIAKFDNANALVWSTYLGGSRQDIGFSICTDNLNNVIVTGSTSSFNFPVLNSFQPTNLSTNASPWVSKKDVFVSKFTNVGVLLNSSYLGGESDEIGTGVATDASGNIFLGGQTYSTNFPVINPGNGEYTQGTSGWKANIFITKLTNSFVPVWSTYYTGSGNEMCLLDSNTVNSLQGGGSNITVDGCGNVYLGFMGSVGMPVQQPCSGYFDGTGAPGGNFLVKFNNAGVRLWATYHIATLDIALTVDNNDNLFVAEEWNATGFTVVNPGGSAYCDTTYNGSGLGDDTGISKFIASLPATYSTSITPAGCNCAGSASVTATSGCIAVTWYNSSWVLIGNNPSISNLCPGNYQAIVIDPENCIALIDTVPFIITGSTPTIVTPQNQTICTGQTTTLTATGGSSYSWSTGNTTSSISVSPTVNSTYTLIAVNGICTDTIIDSVFVSSTVVATTTNSTICTGQNATLTASGGTNYSWSNSSSTSSITVSPTSSTTYSVIVSNGSCSSTATAVVTVNPLPTSNAGNDITICSGDNVTLNGTGNGTYVWNPGGQTTTSITVSPTVNSSYTFSVTNSCGTSDDSVTISISTSNVASITGNTNLCSGQSTTLTASGGSTFSWSTGQSSAVIIVSPTSNTTYSVTVHSGSCADSTSITVNVIQTPTASVTPNITICSGQIATLSANGGGNYSWSNGNTTSSVSVSPTINTTYSVIVSNVSCADTASVLVNVNPTPSANILGNTTICMGGNATLTASGGTTYSWNTTQTSSSIIVSPTATSTYSVIASNGNCTDTASVTVSVVSGITASIAGNTTVCYGQNSILTASGGTNYSWSTGATTSSITISQTSVTTYSVVAINGSCSDTTSITVSIDPLMNTTIPSFSVCPGNPVQLNYTIGGGTPPYTYSWSTGATTSSITANPTLTTTYTLSISDSIGCSASWGIPVVVFATPTVTVNGNIILCSGDTTTLTANGGVAYSWSTGTSSSSIIVAPTANATYSVIGTNANGCNDTVSVSVTVSPPPTANITGNDTICFGDNTLLTASGGGNYLWNTLQTSASIVVSPATNTNYSVVVSIGSCKDTANYFVAVIPNPTANAGASVNISQGQSATLTASGGGTYSWNNGMTGISIVVNPTTTTQYCVWVTDVNGCSDSSCVTVFVEPIDCSTAGELFIPNAFSPNDDGENDFLQIFYGNFSCIKEYKIIIYNRWGEKVFESTEPNDKWDGVFRGKKEETAVFAYYVKAVFIDKTEIERKGNISLIK